MDSSRRPTKQAFLLHKQQGQHSKNNFLRDIILGGQDGLVNALGIILGFSAVSTDVNILIATVLAASAAESISMGAVAYTSALAQKDYYESELRKEEKEIAESPEMEKEEIRQMFEAKGFTGNVLEEIVKTITADKKIWLETMMREELGLEKVNTNNVLRSAIIVGVTTAIGSIIPVLPFFFIRYFENFHTGLFLSLGICALTLFAVGAYQALTLVGSWWKSGIRMVIIGLSATLIGFVVAKLFHATPF